MVFLYTYFVFQFLSYIIVPVALRCLIGNFYDLFSGWGSNPRRLQ